MSVDSSAVSAALAVVRARIDAVERPYSHTVDVMAVTKGFDGSAITAAAAAGCSTIGENYAQEVTAKRDDILAVGVDVSFIGRLQSNKVRQIADLVTVWSSIDRPSIAEEVARRAPGAAVLIQVDSTGEPGKGGCPPTEVDQLIDECRGLGLSVLGLMTIGPTGQPPEAARTGFRTVRELVERHGLAVCSMGMTGDLEVAVAEGSSQVRIGSALFGPRPAR